MDTYLPRYIRTYLGTQHINYKNGYGTSGTTLTRRDVVHHDRPVLREQGERKEGGLRFVRQTGSDTDRRIEKLNQKSPPPSEGKVPMYILRGRWVACWMHRHASLAGLWPITKFSFASA